MTEEILDIIKQIKLKFIDINDKYTQELSKNEELISQLNVLTSSIEEKEQQHALLTTQISALKEEIIILSGKATNPISAENKDAEIDLLVREIEHCINQLKIN